MAKKEGNEELRKGKWYSGKLDKTRKKAQKEVFERFHLTEEEFLLILFFDISSRYEFSEKVIEKKTERARKLGMLEE